MVDLVTLDSEVLNKLNRQLASKGGWMESKPLIGLALCAACFKAEEGRKLQKHASMCGQLMDAKSARHPSLIPRLPSVEKLGWAWGQGCDTYLALHQSATYYNNI